MKTREIEIVAEFPSKERFTPIAICTKLGFVIRELWDEEEKEWINDNVKFGEIALIIIEKGKESYLHFKQQP